MKKKTFAVLAFALLLAAIFTGCGAKEPEITATLISSKLEAVSELVSAKMTYNGIIEYVDGKVPFLTQKEFLMTYHAEVKAGIDLSQLEIEVTEKDVTIRLPGEVSTDIHVDPDSIKFYAEKKAIFNPEDKEDTVAAIQAAEEDILENGGIEELKQTAKEEAILLIRSFVEEIIGEKTLTVIS